MGKEGTKGTKEKEEKEEIDKVLAMVDEVQRRGIVLTETMNEWFAIGYSLAEGGDEMRDAFHTLASMAGNRYNRKDSDRLFNRALKKVGDGGEYPMQHFKNLCWDHGIRPKLVPTANVRSGKQTKTIEKMSEPKKIYSIDACWVERCLSEQSNFVRSLVTTGLLSEEQMHRAVQRYRLGAMRDGSVIYWQIDATGRVRDGKVMQYGTDGHRLKTVNPTWMGWLMRKRLRDGEGKLLLPIDWQAERCLFGLHLLADAPADRKVCVVEAEKTAVICSELVDAECVWMASGGLTALTPTLLAPLKGRCIKLFPDTDTTGEAYRTWCDVADKARREYGLQIEVSDILERQASDEQKARKVDLADCLDPPLAPPSKGGEGKGWSRELTEMVEERPELGELIERFELVEVP